MDINDFLGDVRKEIDAVDKELLPLFLKRMQCSARVAEIKRANGLPVYDAAREARIIESVRKRAGDEFADSAAGFYTSIMGISREHQHKLLKKDDKIEVLVASSPNSVEMKGKKIYCQGVEGAYSDLAAHSFFGDSAKLTFCAQFADVFRAVESGDADYGVVPVENSAAGSVVDVYSLIMKYRYYIVGAVNVAVRHSLAAKEGSLVKKVFSHPQAIMQCHDYITSNGYISEEFSNTAAAAKFVAESDDTSIAAICSEQAAENYGLKILDSNIQDAKNNHTRFAVISRTPVFPADADKISLILSVPNTPGSLYRTLERFALNGLNLTKIESRPIKDSNFDYDFYLDFTGNIHEKNILDLLSSLSAELERFSLLGNYREML